MFNLIAYLLIKHHIPVADLKGASRDAPPAQNFFIFMQFSGKIGQIIGWCPHFGLASPPLGLAPPPLGNPGSATAYMEIYRVSSEQDVSRGSCRTDLLQLNRDSFV